MKLLAREGEMICPECDGQMYLMRLVESELIYAAKEHIWKECWYCEGAGKLSVTVERMDDE
jgi:hypothetical protein